MSGIDWDPKATIQATMSSPILPLALPFDRLPEDVKAMLTDPERPVAVEAVDVHRLAGRIFAHAEATTSKSLDHEDNLTPEEYHARAAWQRRRLAEAGYGAAYFRGPDVRFEGREGTVTVIPPEYVDTNHDHAYERMVREAVMVHLRAEHAAIVATMTKEAIEDARDDRDVRAAAILPLDGEGMSKDEYAAVIGKSKRTAEVTLGRLVEGGYARYEEVPTARGGAKRKVFFRVERGDDDDVGDEG